MDRREGPNHFRGRTSYSSHILRSEGGLLHHRVCPAVTGQNQHVAPWFLIADTLLILEKSDEHPQSHAGRVASPMGKRNDAVFLENTRIVFHRLFRVEIVFDQGHAARGDGRQSVDAGRLNDIVQIRFTIGTKKSGPSLLKMFTAVFSSDLSQGK